jgi:CheY-like chemotaxis protein
MADQESVPSVIRLLIADDHPAMREGLRSIFSRDPEVAVVAVAATGDEAVVLTDRWERPKEAVVAVIEVTDLRKSYGRSVALDGVSFDVEDGEILAYSGRTVPARPRRSRLSRVLAGRKRPGPRPRARPAARP